MGRAQTHGRGPRIQHHVRSERCLEQYHPGCSQAPGRRQLHPDDWNQYVLPRCRGLRRGDAADRRQFGASGDKGPVAEQLGEARAGLGARHHRQVERAVRIRHHRRKHDSRGDARGWGRPDPRQQQHRTTSSRLRRLGCNGESRRGVVAGRRRDLQRQRPHRRGCRDQRHDRRSGGQNLIHSQARWRAQEGGDPARLARRSGDFQLDDSVHPARVHRG